MTSQADLTSFANYLSSSRRILALVGAGLSASSGIPTFRGAGGLWRQHRTKELASSYAFNQSPGTVWQFYGERRHWALTARPNQAHYALAELARKKKDFIMITQNVDGNTLITSIDLCTKDLCRTIRTSWTSSVTTLPCSRLTLQYPMYVL